MSLKENNNHLLTPLQLAERLGYAVTTIRKWARQGRIPAIKIGDDWRFTEGLTFPSNGNTIDGMGRRKKGYKGPKYLIKKPGSPFWYIKWQDICKSTETEDLAKAQMILAEEQRVFWAKQILEERTGASLPFSSLIGRYLREITPEKRSPKSDYTNSRKPLEYWADKKIDTFTVQDMYRYQEWRKAQFVQRRKSKNPGSNDTKKKPISGATINRELSLVKHALRKAVRWGYISQSPIPEGEVEGMREQRRDRYITNQELRAIKEKSSSQTFRDIVDALYFTGLRAGRILTLRWNQINFDERILTFEETSRNKRVPREIPINDSLHTILCRLRDQRKYRAIISPFVFYSLNGKPYRTIKTAWNGACRRAGVMNARIHDIRHKTLSDMAKAGIPLATIKRAAGHSQVQTTDGYTHLQIDDLRIAFGVLTEK